MFGLSLTGFATPWWLLLIVVVAALAAGYLLAQRSRRKRTLRFTSLAMLRWAEKVNLDWRYIDPGRSRPPDMAPVSPVDPKGGLVDGACTANRPGWGLAVNRAAASVIVRSLGFPVGSPLLGAIG